MSDSKRNLTISDLKDRGWTTALINEFLIKEDRKEHPTAAPIALYHRSRVEQIEKSERFLRWKEKSDRRSSSARHAVKSRSKERSRTMFSIRIHVRKLPESDLLDLAITDYNLRLEKSQKPAGTALRPANRASRTFFLNRICVTYAMHNLTTFEYPENTKARFNEADLLRILYADICDEIGKIYPDLKYDANRQKSRFLSSDHN